MAIEKKFFEKKRARDVYLALIFLVFVCIVTGALFFYNRWIISENEILEQQITEREVSINKLNKKKDIEAYYIYSLNQKILDRMAQDSKISKFIEHTLKVMIRYDLVFENFSYSNGKINLSATSESNERGLAYTKIIKFMKEYNKNKASLFHLEPIQSFS